MIDWKHADDFYRNAHLASGKPVLLLVHNPELAACQALADALESLSQEADLIEQFFALKVCSLDPSPNERRLIDRHIFVASPVLQVLNADGSRSHECRYVPRHTRHSKGYRYTHAENSGSFDRQRLETQLRIGLAKYHYFNGATDHARRLAQALLSEHGDDRNALEQAWVIENWEPDGRASFLHARLNHSPLTEAIMRLLASLCRIADREVMAHWPFSDGDGDWRWYTDCVRELAFQVYQELVSAAQAIELAVAPRRAQPRTHAILANWHASYRKLQADFIGVPDALLDATPLEHERSLRENLVHCLLCEGSAHGLQILNTLHPDAAKDFEAHQAEVGEATADIGPGSALFSQYEQVHQRLLAQFAGITDAQLSLRSRWWEPEPVALKFRLDRLGWHLQDHLCTHRKLLAELSYKPQRVHTFAQVIFEGMAQVECAALGFEPQLQPELAALVAMLNKRATECVAFAR